MLKQRPPHAVCTVGEAESRPRLPPVSWRRRGMMPQTLSLWYYTFPHQPPHQATLASALLIFSWGCSTKDWLRGGPSNRNLLSQRSGGLKSVIKLSTCGFPQRPMRENLPCASPRPPGASWPSLMVLGLQKPHPHLRLHSHGFLFVCVPVPSVPSLWGYAILIRAHLLHPSWLIASSRPYFQRRSHPEVLGWGSLHMKFKKFNLFIKSAYSQIWVCY